MDTIVAAISDLFFTVKVIDAAKKAGRKAKFVKALEPALASLRDNNSTLLVVDLNCRDMDTVELIRAVKSDPALSQVRTLGFLSHVQEDLKQRAVEAGCDQVVPRSVFSDRVNDLLAAGA